MLGAVLTGEVSTGMSSEIEEIARADDAALARLARLIEPGSLLEATPECLVVAHADGRIVFANHHVQALTGFSRDDLVGKPVDLLLASDVRDRGWAPAWRPCASTTRVARSPSRCTSAPSTGPSGSSWSRSAT